VRRHTQIVTLSVDVDLAKVPPPEQWDWNQVGVALGDAAHVTLLASGRVMPSVQREKAEAKALAEQFQQIIAAIPVEGLTDEARDRLGAAVEAIGEIAFAGTFEEAVRDIAELPA
jgi:hypothetical protein